ncbi:MAG: 3-deoxy-manno-octulosonate cytidylyltransferase [Bacteroidetes bacterium]|nr:MAG: 3-deoxy-manno-octulosonate cytidylyltransferase [Bacteroidota bacterium]MBL1143470.1 3-deoxy-manno-octulosonate cytidylyltransferase [Bacteroidota bacterium]NOG56273.1 3-deoxy-manno-octulosonate cytidylyltransferase [Bacteroidota bacterium]
MRTIGIIPARYESSRFPGKPLALINGKSMIQRVYEQAKKANSLHHVVVATDDKRIIDAVKAFDGEVVLTSKDHLSGTDRCLEAVNTVDYEFDVVVNIQGDEPYISPEQIDLILSCFSHENTEIATLIKLIEKEEELFDTNRPKVVVDDDDFAVYFSRQTIPHLRGINQKDWVEQFNFYKHIGMYAYRVQTLKEICQLKQSRLEIAEGLEQLRWIESGYKIRTAITEEESHSIDTPEDLENLLKDVQA